MRRTILVLSLSMMATLLFALQFSAAPLLLRVNEKSAALEFGTKETIVMLPVENVSGRSLSAQITVELIDTNDKVRGRGERQEELGAGQESVRVPVSFDFNSLDWSEKKKLPFYRLRYSVSAGETSGARLNIAEGVISLSEITPELFELRLSAPRQARDGARYRVRAHTTHPITRRAVGGVKLTAEIELERNGKSSVVLEAAATTDAQGQAALDFNLPANIEEEQAKVRVTGRLKVFEQDTDATVEFDRTARLLLTTDKTLYQPGQTLHLRALVFDPNERALPAATATFTVEDPESATVFRADAVTTRFGVAATDWQIPESTPLGDYRIKVELEEGRFEDSIDSKFIKISRYDLPNFVVNAKADRSYYLPGQNADVEVRADYLFGEPVKRGRVRLVRETERRWNFKEQKWETEEGETIEGELDSAGRFIARINLEDEHESLAGESYSRFSDLTFAAYLTDATTNRTEQRRFDLRLTKEPIHIYVAEGGYNQAQGMPVAFYVSASYADGSPAQCEISVDVGDYKESAAHYYGRYAPRTESVVSQPAARVAVVKTNRYGLAKVTAPTIAGEGDANRYLTVKLSARDRKGLTGSHDEGMWIDGESDLRVETDKPVYGVGEPVRALITSNRRDATVFVDVTNASRVIRSEAVRLEDGRATVTFPYGNDFDGRLSVVASFYEQPKNRYTDGEVSGRRIILYPRDRELKLDVQMGQMTYRPGEEAEATLSAKGADGSASESVFGVVIFDKAVEERARTDREFGSSYGFYGYFHSFRYGTSEVGGISMRDLELLDVKRKPMTADLSLAAEILLYTAGYYEYDRASYESNSYEKNHAGVFGPLLGERLKSVKAALDERYEKRAEYPSDAETLRRFLKEAQIDFDRLRDPWNLAYRAAFSSEREKDVTEIISAGPDKTPGTSDDFHVLKVSRPYFRSLGERINKAVNDYHARTKGFIRDEETLRAELARAGIEPSALRDRWGVPYRFEFGTMGVLVSIRVKSGGPDKRFAAQEHYGSDDFTIWTTLVDSFTYDRDAIEGALNSYLQATGKFPQDEATFREALKWAGIDRDRLRDHFGRTYMAGFRSESRYVDRVSIEGRYDAGSIQQKRTAIVPVSQRVFIITLKSAGADAKGGTGDEFNAATFTSIAREQSASGPEAKDSKPLTTFKGATGALTGTVTDPMGAVIPGANVKAVNTYNSAEYSAVTDDSGVYIIRNLPPGLYTVTVTSPGFMVVRIESVPLRSSALIKVDAVLEAASVSATVTVTSGASMTLNTTDSSVSNEIKALPVPGQRPGQLSTPRLREYFPETLVWQPALETDKDGRAQLRFKLADNITTWKMSVIGSTENGEIGTIEREIRAFQPFFVEHDPPRILTEGDEIALPVVLRNYLDKQQSVALEIKPEEWFSLTGASSKRAEIRAGDAAREVFNFRATASVKDGKQRITAIGEEASDAIEKPVTVHPDGEERAETDSRIFTDKAALEAQIPPDAIKGSLSGELKIYPNLIGHVIESIEAIMQRPYGCGEQTVSSTYPSLLVLKAYKRNGVKPPDKLGARALRYLRSGYERLLNYRAESGGFSYWGGRSETDVALTAYALRFLMDAREFIEVDEVVIDNARQWLIKGQLRDGAWPGYAYGDVGKDAQAAMTTALIARSLARSDRESAKTDASGAQNRKALKDALALALQFLDRKVEEMNEPYLLASYALAALDAGDVQRAERAVARLRRLALQEGDGSYWSMENNTPFYGWGLAGRVETTALVLQALTRGSKSVDEETDALVRRGLLFLLKRKDRYGVWHSTQATINVLDAMTALLSNSSAQPDRAPGTASIIVNGRTAATVQLPPAGQLTGPVNYDISSFLSAGNNRVEIMRAGGGGGPLSAQVITNYYLPWTRALSGETRAKNASTLKLSVSFDKTEVNVTNEVTCKVRAERIAPTGYGMMLAEIGLPPGADVDRASLERAMKELGWSFKRYDLLPDRLVVYLWPPAGGTTFEFKFRPRFGLNALTAPSMLYDYYNPEAQARLAPVRFIVR